MSKVFAGIEFAGIAVGISCLVILFSPIILFSYLVDAGYYLEEYRDIDD